MIVLGGLGAGRTTLARALTGVVPQRTAGSAEGALLVAGNDAAATPLNRSGAVVGLAGPDAAGAWLLKRVADHVAFPLASHGWPPRQIHARVHELLGTFGLAEKASLPVRYLSAGERTRLALAAALAPRPSLLVLDQPLGHLDADWRATITGLLRALLADKAQTIVLIEQPTDELLDLSERVLLLASDGQQLYFGNAAGVAAEHVAQLHVDGAWLPAAWSRSLATTNDADTHKRRQSPADADHPLLVARGLTVELSADYGRSRRLAVAGLNLELPAGRRVCLAGRNGAGATVLLRVLAGHDRPTRGTVLVGDGTRPAAIDPRRGRAAQVARLVRLAGDRPGAAVLHPTVAHEVSGTPPNRRTRSELWAEIEQVLGRFGTRLPADGRPAALSSGQQRLVQLAGVLWSTPGVLLLDHPGDGLDQRAWQLLVELLDELRDLGQAQLVATHDARLIERADAVVMLDDDGIARSGRGGRT